MYTLSSLNCISSSLYIYIYIIVIIVTNSCEFYLQLVIFEILLSYHHHYFWTDNAFNFMFSKIYHTIYSIYLSYCGCLNLSYCGWQREILINSKPPVLWNGALFTLFHWVSTCFNHPLGGFPAIPRSDATASPHDLPGTALGGRQGCAAAGAGLAPQIQWCRSSALWETW